jgi:PAS domain-containing protein
MNSQCEAYIIHDGVIIKDANQAFCDLFRCERETLIDRLAVDIVDGSDLRELAKLRAHHLLMINEDYGRIFEQSYTFRRFDGTTFFGVAVSQRISETDYKTVVKWNYDDR